MKKKPKSQRSRKKTPIIQKKNIKTVRIESTKN